MSRLFLNHDEVALELIKVLLARAEAGVSIDAMVDYAYKCSEAMDKRGEKYRREVEEARIQEALDGERRRLDGFKATMESLVNPDPEPQEDPQ